MAETTPLLNGRSRETAEKQATAWQTTLIALGASIGYIVTYFVRYPLFVVPSVDAVNGIHVKMGGLPVKTWFSIASTAGYGLSKIPAYKYASTLGRQNRMSWILGLITMQALFTVGGFAVLPNWARAVGIFLGSFPGSWVYCVVFRYLEGRRTTELLNSVITLSIVFAGASARSVGSSMIDAGLPEDWMPLVAAGSIFPISVVAFLVLDRMPGQSKAEQDGRSERRAMGADERAAFIARFWPGIALLLLNYTLIVAFRSFRDFFASDIYTSTLGRAPNPSLYILADWPGGIASCLLMGFVVKIKDSRRAILALHGIVAFGAVLMLVAVGVHELTDRQHPELFIVWVGVGFFVAWGPLGSLMFERLLAASGTPGTAIFLIYLSDGCGYLGTMSLLVYHGVAKSTAGLGELYIWASGALAVAILILASCSGFYFWAKLKAQPLNTQRLRDTAGETSINTAQPKTLI